MARKFRTFVPGGLQKAITLPDGTGQTQGTQIAGFAGQILTIDQLKTLLGLNQPNTQTPPGGSSSGSGAAAIALGPGLAGGGTLLGNVRINLLDPGRVLVDEPSDEQLLIPGPVGMRGQQGPVGQGGPAVYLTDDNTPEEPLVVPGPRGIQGLVGPTGPQGPAGSGGAASPVYLYEDAPSDEPIYFGAPQRPGLPIGFANPTAHVGPTATNGTALTAMRSDAAPAIDLTANYTWTGEHFFNGLNGTTFAASGINLGCATTTPILALVNTALPTDQKIYRQFAAGSAYSFSFTNDAYTAEKIWLNATRTGTVVTGVTLGNSSDNPPITFTSANVTVAPSGADAVLNLASTGTPFSAYIGLTDSTGLLPAFIGWAGGANSLTAGTIRGDLVLRTSTSNSICISLNGGAGLVAAFAPALMDFATNYAIRFSGSSALDANDGRIGNLAFAAGLNIVGLQTTSGAGRFTSFFGFVQSLGPVSNAFWSMDADASGFTPTFAGFSSNPSGIQIVWNRNGSTVTLNMYGTVPATGTSNNNTFTLSGLPTQIQPVRPQYVQVPTGGLVDNGNATTVQFYNARISGGTVTFYNQGSATGWTPVGNKGFAQNFSITYEIA